MGLMIIICGFKFFVVIFDVFFFVNNVDEIYGILFFYEYYLEDKDFILKLFFFKIFYFDFNVDKNKFCVLIFFIEGIGCVKIVYVVYVWVVVWVYCEVKMDEDLFEEIFKGFEEFW